MALQTFTAGQVLTAAQMTALQTNDFNQTVSTKTANYTFVVGDRGTRVVGNGTSITFTVDNTIFSAGDTIKIHNINSTALTIAAGAGVTINAAAGLTMLQYQEATLFATSASSFILFESTAATTTQGLTLINTTSFSGVSSVSLPASTFTSTYRNYKIVLNFSATSGAYLTGRLRASGADDSTSNYGSAFNYQSLTASNPTGDVNATATQTSFTKIAYHTASNDNSVAIDLFQPQVSGKTFGLGFQMRSDAVFVYAGLLHQGTTSFDSFTFIPGAGTITGSVNVYGYNV